jgi:hypothetical protein
VELAERLHQMQVKELVAALKQRGVSNTAGVKLTLVKRLLTYLERQLHSLEDDPDERRRRGGGRGGQRARPRVCCRAGQDRRGACRGGKGEAVADSEG